MSWFKVFGSKTMALMLLLGFSSGLPLALTLGTLQAWMTDAGVNLKLITLYSFVGLPYALKFVWAPLLDRYSLPFLGPRRGWILVCQLVLLVAIAFLGQLNPLLSPWWVALGAFIVSLASASQDIVLDAWRTENLSAEERGAGAGVWVLGYRLAMLVSGALALILADHLPWSVVYGVMALTMILGMAATLWAPENRFAPRPLPSSLKDAVILPFVQFFTRPAALWILGFLLLYKLGDVAAGAITTPYVLKMGYSKTELGSVVKLVGMLATILGGVLGGILMVRWSLRRSLWVFGLAQALVIPLFPLLQFKSGLVGQWAGIELATWLLAGVVCVEYLGNALGTTAYTALMMALCDLRFTATQYALISSVMAVTRSMVGGLTGTVAESVGWTAFFGICTLMALPGMLILLSFKRWGVEKV